MNILIIDDEESILEQAGLFLKNENSDFNILTGSSVDEGLKILEEKDLDIIVSDYQMPHKDGIEFLEEVRKERGENIPFIVFTGKGREEVAIKALNLGANRYIQKGGDPRSQYSVLAKTIEKEIEHKETEKEVKWLRNEYKDLFNNVKDMVFIHDFDGNIIEVNDTAVETMGYDREELKSMNLQDIDSKPTKKKIEKRIDELTKKKSIKFEGSHITKTGERIPVEINSNVIEYRGKEAILGVARDITDRKKKEKRVKVLKEVIDIVRKINQLIVKEKDLDRLLNRTTDKFVSSDFFNKAWIGLLDENGLFYKTFISEIEKGTDKNHFTGRLKDGYIPNCSKYILDNDDLKMIEDYDRFCGDCPLSEKHTGKCVASIKIKHEEKVYGVMNVSFSVENEFSPKKKELSPVEELADDLGYAIHNIFNN